MNELRPLFLVQISSTRRASRSPSRTEAIARRLADLLLQIGESAPPVYLPAIASHATIPVSYRILFEHIAVGTGHSQPRFFVSPRSFDNIGAVLNELGQGFAHEVIGWGELKQWRATAPHDVLFLNCAMRFGFWYAKKAARMVRSFVEGGGTLYASDWALAAVKEAFPGMIDLDGLGAKGITHCDVVDRGLQEMIGKRVEIEFDMGSWRRLVRLDSSVHVYLAASGGGSANASTAMPIVVGFRHGDGHVLCTRFTTKRRCLIRSGECCGSWFCSRFSRARRRKRHSR